MLPKIVPKLCIDVRSSDKTKCGDMGHQRNFRISVSVVATDNAVVNFTYSGMHHHSLEVCTYQSLSKSQGQCQHQGASIITSYYIYM